MKTPVLQFAPALRHHRTRAALSAAWIATGNPRRPLACVWIDREMRTFAAHSPTPGAHALAGTAAEDEVPLLRALGA